MPKNQIELSIVIVSSRRDTLKTCLKSIYEAKTKLSLEIIVVDNASIGSEVNGLKNDFKSVKFIRRDENGGFGENNNLGMRIAVGRYVLLLNDDTKIIQENIFDEMLNWMDKNPKVGVSGCALMNPDMKSLQGSGGYFPTLFRVFAWWSFLDDIPFLDRLIKPYHPLHGWSPFYKGDRYFMEPHKQDWVTGAFYLMRKKALDKVGLFDEDFFLYVEEVDLSYRFTKSGWEIWYLPQWRIVHYGQMTTGSERAILDELKNLILFYEKHYPKWQIPILRVILKLGIILRFIVFGILKGVKVSKIYAKAFSTI